jgi:hypothetical protein
MCGAITPDIPKHLVDTKGKFYPNLATSLANTDRWADTASGKQLTHIV